MNTVPHEPAQILNEDLLIVHATLASIVGEVERYSDDAAHAVSAAMEQVHAAQDTLSRLAPAAVGGPAVRSAIAS